MPNHIPNTTRNSGNPSAQMPEHLKDIKVDGRFAYNTPYILKNPNAHKYRSWIKIETLNLILIFLISSLSLCTVTAQNGLLGEYYDGTNFDKKVTSRIDSKIDLHWNNTPPVPGINPHECSIRWTGQLKTPKAGTYTFSARVDDGIRVWVGDKLVIDDWRLNDMGRFKGSIYMEADTYYDLKVEYFNALIEGEITLLWELPDDDRKWYHLWTSRKFEVVESSFFYQPTQEPNEEQELSPEYTTSTANIESVPISKKRSSIPKTRAQVSSNTKLHKVADDPIPPTEQIVTVATVKEYTPSNVQFERMQSTILPESYEELDILATFLNEHPYLQLKIEGHTDAVGNADKNLELSQQRAYAVASYLVKKDVAPIRIKAEGFGGSRPLVQRLKTDEQVYYPQNRRVEFIITGIEEQEY